MDSVRYKAKWQQAFAQGDEDCEPLRLAQVFSVCSDLYAGILNDLLLQKTLQQSTLISLERPYSYFLLWANGYGVADGSMEASLHKSKRARHATFRILISISRSLTESKQIPTNGSWAITNVVAELLPALNIETQAKFSAKASQLTQVTNRLRSCIVQATLDNNPSETGMESDDDSMDEIEDLLEIAEDLRTDTQCLMDLGARFTEPALGGETTSNVDQEAAPAASCSEAVDSPVLAFPRESAVSVPVSMSPNDQMAEQRQWRMEDIDKDCVKDMRRFSLRDDQKSSEFDNIYNLPISWTMSRNDGDNAEKSMPQRAGKPLDDGVRTVQAGSTDELQSHAYKVSPPPLHQKPLIRSQPTKDLPQSWISGSLLRRGSPVSATNPQSFDSSRRPSALKSRHDASRNIPSHASKSPVVLDLTRKADGVGSSGLRSFRSRSSSYLPTIRPVSPSMLSEKTTTYTYDYLNQGEFRLITIYPRQKTDTEDIIRCEIFPSMLSESPDYIALSYTWGDPSDKRKILTKRSNMTLSVSASLESALRALRDPRSKILVWADALCIDQQNASEKADQVRQMTQIYQNAKSVAIWLGPQSKGSDLGMELIHQVSSGAKMPRDITKHTPTPFSEQNFAAVVALFDREYWHRLWVVQEVFNAQLVNVHCGPAILPWTAFRIASKVFRQNRDVLERSFHPGYYTQVLVNGGPGSLAGIGTRAEFKNGANLTGPMVFQDLLEVMRDCRRKLSSKPEDKVFGILGVLSEKVRNEIKVDYSIPVKDVYINIFRTIVEKTDSLDILCESIHFPTYTNNNNLPSWVPDWSHNSRVSPIGNRRVFSASRKARVDVDFTEKNKLRIRAIPLGRIKEHGIAVGTLCTVDDYLMAFLQWRACLSHCFGDVKEEHLQWLKRRFCLVLSLDHTLKAYDTSEAWMDVCYQVFACTIRDRLPTLQMDHELEQYIRKDFQMDYNKRRLFIQEHFGSNMMGRCFCITDGRRLGMGTGFMARGDVVVVPLGCSTPVVLRPEGDGYRFVGDVFINGYMDGKAVEECNDGYLDRQVRSYVIH